jgi:hypothetical protein
MDAPRRTRSCCRRRAAANAQPPRGAKQLVLPMDRATYDRIWHDAAAVRQTLHELLGTAPELFPAGLDRGFQLTGRLPPSKKLPGVRLRQVRLADGRVFTLRPSFVLSYMTGTVDAVAYPLLLLSYGVPTWVVTHGYGHNDMYWHRLVERLGRNSLVGTTVRDPQRVPPHLVADEHHASWCGAKGYVALTAGGGCVLGAARAPTADEDPLTAAYEVFRDEVRAVHPDYAPQTVNTDGPKATHNAWQALFTGVAIVLCFLHGFLKIRDRGRKLHELHRRVWEVFRAATAADFVQRMAAFRAWWQPQTWAAPVREARTKLADHAADYAGSYAHPGCHRTSNLVDRLMNRLYRVLYAGRGLHGHQATSERRLRGWALLLNFRPFAPRGRQRRAHQSPAHRLNNKKYHDHWLHNLQVSASLAGFRAST